WDGAGIGRELRKGKTDVFRYPRSPTFAEPTYKRRRHSILNPYKGLLLQHWNQGCHDARQVFQRLQQQGYRGSYATVARYAQRLRQVEGLAPPPPNSISLPLPVLPNSPPSQLTPRGSLVLALPATVCR